MPNWNDVVLRWRRLRLLGNRKTAVKFTFSKCRRRNGGIHANANLVVTSVTSVTRNWTDSNGNFTLIATSPIRN